MDASGGKPNTFTRPKPISELLPDLSGILSKDAMIALSVKKQPRATMLQTRTTEKVFKPMTLAEMRAELQVLKPQSSRRMAQNLPSAKKKGWNSSVKIEKKISHTADGQLKNATVRKVLNFQPKPKAGPNPRTKLSSLETPKFQKPELRAKKSLYLQATNSIRISGICNIPQTPVETQKPVKTKMTIANKENNPYQSSLCPKIVLAPPTPKLRKIATPKVATPLSNSSWKSGSDASFLQKEKEILDVEEKVKAIIEEQTLENIADVSPPVSTPFKEYRSVQDYFNNSSCVENSALYNDNTIMCFDKPSICKENDIKEESVIMSLCDLFNKATVVNEKTPTELDNLLEVEKQTENNIRMLENGIQILTKIKLSQEESLKNLRNLIDEKQNGRKVSENDKNKTGRKISENDKDKTLVPISKEVRGEVVINNMTLSPEKSPILSRPCSVVKPRSPAYKVPKKNLSLRKTVICKSMPNVNIHTPVKVFDGKALNVYMKMKKQMNFLSTPMINREMGVPDTPALTSHNIQKQLDKLFDS